MEELNGYTPPASLNLNDFQDAIGDAVVQAIIKIGIRVNREELLKALKYDRGQYKAGYEAGFADAFVETLHIVRCRDCTAFEQKGKYPAGMPEYSEGMPYGYCYHWDYERGMSPNQVDGNDFCSYGERRAENENHT